MLWTSHNMYEVEAVCDRVLFLSHGRSCSKAIRRRLPGEHGVETLDDLFVSVAHEPLAAGGGGMNRSPRRRHRAAHPLPLPRQPARVFPLFAWVAIDIVLWGFITRYLNSVSRPRLNFVPALLGAVLLWDFLTRVMQGVTMAFFEDVWSRNFLNVFATPLSISEYLAGLVIAGDRHERARPARDAAARHERRSACRF